MMQKPPAYMVLLVVDKMELCDAVMEAWRRAGVPGITLLESSGLHRRKALRDDLGLMPSLDALMASQEYTHRTLFTVVPDEALVQRIVQATEEIVGDLNEPYTGILVVLPVLQVYGLRKRPYWEGKAEAEADE